MGPRRLGPLCRRHRRLRELVGRQAGDRPEQGPRRLMSETPRWGSGGLYSNRSDEFSMTGTADALNRPEFHRGSWGPGQ